PLDLIGLQPAGIGERRTTSHGHQVIFVSRARYARIPSAPRSAAIRWLSANSLWATGAIRLRNHLLTVTLSSNVTLVPAPPDCSCSVQRHVPSSSPDTTPSARCGGSLRVVLVVMLSV